MKKLQKFLLVILVICQIEGLCQVSSTPNYEELLFITSPRSFFVSGENVHLSAFSLNKKTLKKSSVSKVGYLVVLNEEREVVHQSKFELRNGRGAIKLFVKSDYPTGHYYVLGFTSLMKNQPIEDFYYKEISVINPFIPYKNPEEESPSLFPDVSNESNSSIQVEMKKGTYSIREKVDFSIKTEINTDLSINVFQLDSFNEPIRSFPSIVNQHLQKAKNKAEPQRLTYFPETKGELLSGFIKGGSEDAEYPLKVFASFPGKEFSFFTSILNNQTDTFHITLPYNLFTDELTISSPDCKECTFDIIEKFLSDYSFVATNPLKISDDQLDLLLERSIKSQVENAYYNIKTTTAQKSTFLAFYGKPDHVYNLEDYTLFRKMDEVFKEITPSISLRKDESGNYVIRAVGDQRKIIENPLVLLDGRLVTDINKLLEVDARDISKIETTPRKYHLGPQEFNAIISIFSKTGDMNLSDEISNKAYQGVIPYHEFSFNQRNKNTPELGQILYWKPIEKVGEKPNNYSFRISDVAGKYMILIEGFDIYGNPISKSQTFIVE